MTIIIIIIISTCLSATTHRILDRLVTRPDSLTAAHVRVATNLENLENSGKFLCRVISTCVMDFGHYRDYDDHRISIACLSEFC